jgi:hypothetical protein
MDDKTRKSCLNALEKADYVARKLVLYPQMSSNNIDRLVNYLRIENDGQECPSFEQLLQFLTIVSFKTSQWVFSSVNVLMVTTMTSEKQPFFQIMRYFERHEDESSLRGFIHDEVPPVPGVPNHRYSTKLWKLLKLVHKFHEFSLNRVTLSFVLSSRSMMTSSSSVRVSFFLRCVIHGSNPRLKLATMSPGKIMIFLMKLIENAAKSGQTRNNIIGIICIFAQTYRIDLMILRKMLKI